MTCYGMTSILLPYSIQRTAILIQCNLISIDDYLLVLLPGYAMHLLDGNAEHEPCHHIILQGKYTVTMVTWTVREGGNVIIVCYVIDG